MTSIPVHRSILAVDMENSTGGLRTNPIKAELRDHVYRLLLQAMAYTGVLAEHCDPLEDRGDGVLALIHPVDSVPKTYLLSRLVPELTRLLVDYNRSLSPGEELRRGLRLRAVVHAGEVHRDANGYFGEALDVAFRLMDAHPVKRHLKVLAGPLVLVVSEDIYWNIVKHEYDGIARDSYRPDVCVRVSGRRRQGWICYSTELLTG